MFVCKLSFFSQPFHPTFFNINTLKKYMKLQEGGVFVHKINLFKEHNFKERPNGLVWLCTKL